MTECVVEVGPVAVRGARQAEERLVSVALECIDDEIALLDEQPVSVAAVWRELFCSVLPMAVGSAVLVCPTWWSSRRIETVTDAAGAAAATVIVRSRAEVLAGRGPRGAVVVEIASELVVVWRAGCVVTVEPRLGDAADVAGAVAAAVGVTEAVLVDAPDGVEGAAELADAIAGYLRANGVTATRVGAEWVSCPAAARVQPARRLARFESPATRWPGVAGAAVVAAVALLCIGVAVHAQLTASRGTEVPMTLLVEGRMAVKVPAQWAVRRITAGPGSARLQAMSPDGASAVLVTQSQVRKGESLPAAAATLRRALDDQPAGVFSEFNPDDRRSGRQAATYRETREGRRIDWSVFVDDAVRIAVGCQSTPGGEQALSYPCEEAVRSAHAVF